MDSVRKVLLVDDDMAVREALGQTLELADLIAVLAGSFVAAKDLITPNFAGIIVSDIRMPGKDGFALLNHVRTVDAELPVILLTGEGDIPMAVRGMAAGAFDFLEKPCGPKDFLAVVDKALKTRALVLENRALRHQVETGDAAARLLRGISAQSERMRSDARNVARTMADVLITGEPGVGTAKMAEVVHLLSAVSMRPFLKLPAAGISAEKLDAAFDQAEGGTLFLDEVANLPHATQFTLLDLLERPQAPRLIAGTYQDLAAQAAEGRFHPDLYYRLEAARIHIPPLRERREDIAVLFRHYVAIACEQAALPIPEIDPAMIAHLMAQDWPGNARGLMNAAMRFAMGLGDGGPGDGGLNGDQVTGLGLVEQLAQVERSLLVSALRRQSGNATEVAKVLKLPRKTLYDKLARHDLKADDYRN